MQRIVLIQKKRQINKRNWPRVISCLMIDMELSRIVKIVREEFHRDGRVKSKPSWATRYSTPRGVPRILLSVDKI